MYRYYSLALLKENYGSTPCVVPILVSVLPRVELNVGRLLSNQEKVEASCLPIY